MISLVIITISLIILVLSIYEGNIINDAITYNRISTKMKDDLMMNIDTSNYFKIKPNSTSLFNIGNNKYGCYFSGNDGVINILECKGGTCVFPNAGDNFCDVAKKYINESYMCTKAGDFTRPGSACYLAYNNSITSL